MNLSLFKCIPFFWITDAGRTWWTITFGWDEVGDIPWFFLCCMSTRDFDLYLKESIIDIFITITPLGFHDGLLSSTESNSKKTLVIITFFSSSDSILKKILNTSKNPPLVQIKMIWQKLPFCRACWNLLFAKPPISFLTVMHF